MSFLILLVFLAGCTTPIGTREMGVRRTYQQINVTAIKEDTYSDASANVLQRFFLEDRFKKDPDKVIELLHKKACEDERRDLLYALSELTYLTANNVRKGLRPAAMERAKSHYLASAVYAYFFLLGEQGKGPLSPYDRRFRVACDLYNTALAEALAIGKEEGTLGEGVWQLPVGNISLEIRSSSFPHPLETFEAFILADELAVYGLTVRDRHPGLGAPFIAVEKAVPEAMGCRSVPGTLFLRVEGDIRDLERGAQGVVELYSSYEKREVEVNGKTVPLENDLTAQLAHCLNQSFFWNVGKRQFRKGQIFESGLLTLQPCSPTRIPVVFVHGTMSSPVWWAEMFNTLRSDPLLRDNYQFWFYLYDSGKPIPFSAAAFRAALMQRVKESDPEGNDEALKQMVLVGHSQGGLLTKVTAVETGDTIIRAITKKAIEELNLTEAEREMVNRYLVYTPLPFVSRVIFIATPHRGSFRAGKWVLRLAKKIVTLPMAVLQSTAALVSACEKMGAGGIGEVGDLRTSMDSMSSKNPGLLAFAEIPLASGIKGHSIIAIKGEEKPPEGDDGVVAYTSAHVDYVESEFIVRSGHSCQGHPLVIEEVRRILLEHLSSLSKQQQIK